MFDLRFYSVSKDFQGEGKKFLVLNRKKEEADNKGKIQQDWEKYIVEEQWPTENERYYVLEACEVDSKAIPVAAGGAVLKSKEDYYEVIKYIVDKKIQKYVKQYNGALATVIFPTDKQLKEVIKETDNIDCIENDSIYCDYNDFIVNIWYLKIEDEKIVMVVRVV